MYDVTEKVLTKFDQNVASAFKTLLQSEYLPLLTVVGNDIKIVTDDTWAFKRTLILKNADNVPADREGYLCIGLSIGFKEKEKRFCFLGETEDYIQDTTEMFAINFDSAEVETEIYNACNRQLFWDNPWSYIKCICDSIDIKSNIPHDYCNSKEKELLPLIRELKSLDYWFDIPEDEYHSFSELKKLAVKFGYSKIEKALSELESLKLNDGRYHRLLQRLIKALCKAQYEPLWRDIYDRIADSQAQYPSEIESVCDRELLVNTRNEIQRLMESRGYIGEYPDFAKDTVMNGIHLVRSYDKSYFIGLGERARHYIHCSESLEEKGHLTIQFLCGTILSKKNEAEQETDIYSCLFNANGRRLFSTVHHYVMLDEESRDEADDLDLSITIATKKAECIKLSKDERREFHGKIIPGFGLFWCVFMIAGGLFAIAMTIAMAIMCIIITIAFGLFDSIPEMLQAIPWWLILVMGWIGFGVPMGIIEVLSLRS